MSPDNHLLALRVGEVHFAIEAPLVAEILRLGPLTRLPGASPHLRGVFHHRGEVLPVIDLRLLAGADARTLSTPSHAVLVELGELRVALVGDALGGLVSAHIGLSSEGNHGFVRATATSSLGPLCVVDLERLLEITRPGSTLTSAAPQGSPYDA